MATLIGLAAVLTLSLMSTQFKKGELIRIIQSQKAAAHEHLDQLSARRNRSRGTPGAQLGC